MFHYVYEITNLINGKKYIGKRSCKCPVIEDRYMGSGTALKNAFRKYGASNFSKKILQICNSEQEAYLVERKTIANKNAHLNDQYYNIVEGGLGISSDYMKEKWRDKDYRKFQKERMMRLWENAEYRKQQSLRMKQINMKLWSDENHRKNIGEKMKKVCANEEYREKMSERVKGSLNPMYGTKHTEEERKHLSETSKKLWQNDEFRNKTIEGLKKVQSTPEYKAKRKILSSKENNGMYGRHHSQESKDKISKAKRGRHLGGDNAQSKKVVLLNTLTIFDAIADVERELKIKHQDISKVCKGKRLSAGKVDGEKAKWIYLEDYNYCLENSIENFDLYKKEKYKK